MMKLRRLQINGKENGCLSAQDYGLVKGLGLFETMALLENELRFWNQHWDRLHDGARKLGLALPKKKILEQQLKDFFQGTETGVVKMLFTGGVPGENLTTVFYLYEWPHDRETWLTEGVKVCLCQTRLSENPLLAGLKHTNRLDYVMATQEQMGNYQEGLLRDQSGHVVEGSISNLFLVKDGIFRTPLLDRCGVAGIMRKQIIQHLENAGKVIDIDRVTAEQLMSADEVFLSNSVMGIWPVIQCDNQQFPRGPQTEKLQRRLVNGQLV